MKKTLFSRRAFLRLLATAFGGTALAGLYDWAELRWLEATQVDLRLPRLPPAFDGFTLAHLSDFHLGAFIGVAEVRAAIDLALSYQPDAIVITGDFVSRLSQGEAEALTTELARLSAPAGVYATFGNWDWWADVEVVAEAVRRAGVTVLRNAHVPLQRGADTLYLAGTDSAMLRAANLGQALAGIPANAPTLLLAHEPDFADTAARDPRLIAQFSGHSHGGQVRLPFLGAVLLPAWSKKYPHGLYTVGSLQLYTNRGVGVTALPVRFNCRPEVARVRLSTG